MILCLKKCEDRRSVVFVVVPCHLCGRFLKVDIYGLVYLLSLNGNLGAGHSGIFLHARYPLTNIKIRITA